jgi:hypothetical protein
MGLKCNKRHEVSFYRVPQINLLWPNGSERRNILYFAQSNAALLAKKI